MDMLAARSASQRTSSDLSETCCSHAGRRAKVQCLAEDLLEMLLDYTAFTCFHVLSAKPCSFPSSHVTLAKHLGKAN